MSTLNLSLLSVTLTVAHMVPFVNGRLSGSLSLRHVLTIIRSVKPPPLIQNSGTGLSHSDVALFVLATCVPGGTWEPDLPFLSSSSAPSDECSNYIVGQPPARHRPVRRIRCRRCHKLASFCQGFLVQPVRPTLTKTKGVRKTHLGILGHALLASLGAIAPFRVVNRDPEQGLSVCQSNEQ